MKYLWAKSEIRRHCTICNNWRKAVLPIRVRPVIRTCFPSQESNLENGPNWNLQSPIVHFNQISFRGIIQSVYLMALEIYQIYIVTLLNIDLRFLKKYQWLRHKYVVVDIHSRLCESCCLTASRILCTLRFCNEKRATIWSSASVFSFMHQ